VSGHCNQEETKLPISVLLDKWNCRQELRNKQSF
jgi:hypothetical protein